MERPERRKNFPDDHDWFKFLNNSSHDNHVPERLAFGLPHSYGRAGNTTIGVTPTLTDRRASPLFIHVHRLENEYVGVLAFLPAQFYLNVARAELSAQIERENDVAGSQLLVTHPRRYKRMYGRGKTGRAVNVSHDWEQIIHDFMGPRNGNYVGSPKRTKNYFPNKVIVL